jgi:hypothetical protein
MSFRPYSARDTRLARPSRPYPLLRLAPAGAPRAIAAAERGPPLGGRRGLHVAAALPACAAVSAGNLGRTSAGDPRRADPARTTFCTPCSDTSPASRRASSHERRPVDPRARTRGGDAAAGRRLRRKPPRPVLSPRPHPVASTAPAITSCTSGRPPRRGSGATSPEWISIPPLVAAALDHDPAAEWIRGSLPLKQ